jgi:hypothetical protein
MLQLRLYRSWDAPSFIVVKTMNIYYFPWCKGNPKAETSSILSLEQKLNRPATVLEKEAKPFITIMEIASKASSSSIPFFRLGHTHNVKTTVYPVPRICFHSRFFLFWHIKRKHSEMGEAVENLLVAEKE